MTTFDGPEPITILHSLSRLLEKCALERTLENQACVMVPSFLIWKVFGHFHAARNVSSYSKLCYWSEYVSCFLFTYATTTATRIEAMPLKYLKQLPRGTKVAFSFQVNEIAYKCGNAFLMWNSIVTLIFELHVWPWVLNITYF